MSGVQIIGSPRSGTSALSWALDAHSGFRAGPESDFVWNLFGKGRLFDGYRTAFDRSDETWLRYNGVDFIEFCSHIGIGIDSLFQSRAEGRRWVESTPAHTLIAAELAYLMPNLQFLHLVRDGRDVVASMLASGFPEDWSVDFEAACRTWAHFAQMGLEFEAAFPQRVLRVSHGALVRDTAGECARMLEFLGVDHEDGPASFLASQRINSSYDNQSPEDIRAVKSTARLKRSGWMAWDQAQLNRFWEIAGDAMRALNLGARSKATSASKRRIESSAAGDNVRYSLARGSCFPRMLVAADLSAARRVDPAQADSSTAPEIDPVRGT